ncbi:MAG: SMR family transporter [Burkholderiales bacterium]
MNAISFSLLMTGVLLNAGAQLLLKAGTNSVGAFEYSSANIVPVGWKLATEPHIIGGLACYVISVVVWIMALSRVEVSVAYPLLSVGYVVNAIAAWYLFGEAVTPLRLAGIGVIIIGVVLVTRS